MSRALRADPPVLLDEWQHLPHLWDKVRRAVDANAPAGSYLLTGSASPDRGGGRHSGAGRIVSVRMRPLSLHERGLGPPTVSLATLLDGHRPPIDGETDVDPEGYVGEILSSGFPAIRSTTGRTRRALLDGYVDRIVERDFPQAGHELRNPAALRRWLTAYAAATSTQPRYETIRDAASAAQANPPARTIGALFQSLVTLSVRICAQAAEGRVAHLRTKGGAREVDLVVIRDDDRVLAIEVKLGHTIDDRDVRHLHWLAGELGDSLLDAVVVTTGPVAYRRTDGIAVLPAALLGP